MTLIWSSLCTMNLRKNSLKPNWSFCHSEIVDVRRKCLRIPTFVSLSLPCWLNSTVAQLIPRATRRDTSQRVWPCEFLSYFGDILRFFSIGRRVSVPLHRLLQHKKENSSQWLWTRSAVPNVTTTTPTTILHLLFNWSRRLVPRATRKHESQRVWSCMGGERAGPEGELDRHALSPPAAEARLPAAPLTSEGRNLRTMMRLLSGREALGKGGEGEIRNEAPALHSSKACWH